MRSAIIALLVFAATCHAQAGKKDSKRFGYAYEPKLYMQDSPQDALKSIVKTLNDKKLAYMMAQLVDPILVDQQVAQAKLLFDKKANAAAVNFLAFDQVVKQTQLHFLEDPQLLKELRMFVKDEKSVMWKLMLPQNLAVATHKQIPARRVFMRRIGARWYLMNKQK